MRTPEVSPAGSRETRLLLVTIAISVGVLFLLARFRFPEQAASQTIESAPAPLERLAARAAYDELASIMADLERRITPRVSLVRLQSPDGSVSMAIAPRLLPDRTVALTRGGAGPSAIVGGSGHELISSDLSGGFVVMRVAAVEDSAVAILQGPPRSGPRYVGLVEPTAIGPVLRPLYIGRLETIEDPRSGIPLLALAGHQSAVTSGSAIFSLEGTFIGLVRDAGDTVTVVPADQLRTAAERAAPASESLQGDLGLEIDSLNAPIARATGAEQGVIVVHVRPGGPSDGTLRPGDVIQSLDGVATSNALTFRELERSRTPGTEVALTTIRARSPVQLTIKTGELGAASTGTADTGLVGRNVAGVGIEVVAVREGGVAQRAGLRRGDLVVALDGQEAPTTEQFVRRFRAEGPVTALVTVQRGGEYRVLAVERR